MDGRRSFVLSLVCILSFLSPVLLAVDFDVFVAGGTLKAVRTAVAARGEGKRVFLAAPRPYCGEDRAATLDLERHPEDDVADPLIREIFNPQYRASGAYNVLPAKGWRAVQKFEPYETVETAPVTGALDTVTTPLLVKRACDRALLAAKVEFLTAAPVVAAERTDDGNWRVTYAVRGGERTVVVREFVDCRLPRRVAKGRHDFSYRVVRGPKPRIETIDFSYDVPTSDARGLLAVENHARSLVGTSNLLDVAEWVTVKDPAETPPMPIEVTCDVVVAGGGTGGGPAAVAAARAGAKTILVEYQNILGGVSSEGRIGGFGSYYDGNVCGFTKELEDGERKLGGAYFFARGEWLRREIVRSGGEVWLGTMVTGAEMSGSRLVGVRVVLPDGTRGLIRCKTAVDATGNSDLAAAAGAKTEFITGDELSLQGCGMAGQPFGAWCVNSDIGFVDETDAADLCFFALRSRLSLPDRVWNQSSLVDSRERRRIVGDFRISPVDLLLNRRYPDVICQARSTFDTHGQTSHPVFFIRDTGKRGDCIRGNVPYRALLPKGVEGLLVTGLGISAHRDAMPVLRMKADIQNQGYAAGLAAALAAKESLVPRQLNVRRLQERLVSVGNLPDEVLAWGDSLPLSHTALESAVERLSDGYDGLPEILSDPVRALPLLRARPGFERAHVRALLGDLTAAPELIARLEGLSWDEGWDYKGMSQYLRSVGTVDRYVIALGRTRAGAALPVLDRLASELTGESAYSHFRALALAYESIGDPRGAAALQRLLALPGVGGHAWCPGEVRPIPGYSDLPTNKERSDALRELCVARALFRLGDPSGAARRSLESYADDPRRAFANHARQVLDAPPAEACKIETVELQAQIDAASARGGGTVSIGPGVHRSGTLLLKDNVTLRLERGAVLKAVHGAGSYARSDGPAFIWATNAVHVAIEGVGTIDGAGDELPRDRAYRPRPRLVLFEDCRDVRVEAVSLRASAFWTLVLHRVDGFAVRRVDILTHAHYNNDGIDLAARNGVVEDCLVESDDDAIVLKTLAPDDIVENVTIRRCRVSSNMNLLKIGTESWGRFRNILFEDIKGEVRHASAVWPYYPDIPNGDPTKPYCKSGLSISVVDGGALDGVTARNIDLKGCLTPVFIRHNRRHVQAGRATFLRNVLIENITAEASSSIASSVTGLPDLRIRDVTIRNVTFVLPGGCTREMCARPVPECEEGVPTNLMFGFHPLPAHGFYVRHADGVKIENARFLVRRPDVRPAIVRDDADAACPCSVPVPDGVYDGAQSNAVVDVTDVGGAKTATLSCRVQTNPNENRTWKVLAQSGDPLKPGGIRLAYNIRREGRIWGVFGGTRVFSPPQALADGKLHHVAFEVSPGRDLRLFVDGRQVATDKAPNETIADGLLTAGQRVVVGSADDGWYYETGRAQHFRGRIVDVAVRKGPFDPRAVAGGVEPREQALTIPPNPLERPAVWERPKTTRRYLQGPFSERLLVYFREGKILFGENEHKDDWSVAYKDLVSHAAWLVRGERAEPLDFRQAELSVSDGGEPDCAQTWRQDGLEISLAACAPWGRRPSAHLRLSVHNLSPNDRTESFGFLLRTAPEKDLVFGAPDIYASYAPSITDWDRIGCSDWKRDGETMRFGDRFAAVREGDFAWDEGRGMLRFGFLLKPGETRTAELELGRGESDGMDFETARAAMCRDWTRELARIRLPKAVADDAAKSRLIRHLAVQMLQCFAHPVDGDAVLPRQGGLQRYVWPGDAISFLSAMDELGYGDHVARAIDFYFDHCIRPTGEAGPFRNRWACDTGCVLESFARHVLLARDEACWRRHRDAAFRAFDWIESKRREGGGLFPSMKSTDHGAASRHWGMTDMYSLTGLTDFAEAAERMGDPRAREVRRAVCDYRAAINGVLDGWKERSSGRDELMIPLTTDGAADDGLLEDYMFASHYGKFADFGFLSEPDMLRVRRWLLRRRYADENGLYSNQVSRNGQRKDEHVWYTTWQDQHWFNAWMRVGRRDLARKTLAATLKFALTDEYLVGERYHDADAWYYPWSPNASGSGRIVQMLLANTED